MSCVDGNLRKSQIDIEVKKNFIYEKINDDVYRGLIEQFYLSRFDNILQFCLSLMIGETCWMSMKTLEILES